MLLLTTLNLAYTPNFMMYDFVVHLAQPYNLKAFIIVGVMPFSDATTVFYATLLQLWVLSSSGLPR